MEPYFLKGCKPKLSLGVHSILASSMLRTASRIRGRAVLHRGWLGDEPPIKAKPDILSNNIQNLRTMPQKMS